MQEMIGEQRKAALQNHFLSIPANKSKLQIPIAELQMIGEI